MKQTDSILKIIITENQFKNIIEELKKSNHSCNKYPQPYIYAITEKSVPSPIFVGGFTDMSKYIFLDDSLEGVSNAEQNDLIKERIIQHFKKHDGGIPGFGKIKHYLVKYSNGHSKSFDTKGIPMTNKKKNDTIGRPGDFYFDGENIGDINNLFKNKTDGNRLH